MNKNEFISVLQYKMSGFPKDSIEKTIEYYGEMIDDLTEDGLSEQDAIETLGSPDEIIKEVLSEMPLSKLLTKSVKPKHKPSPFEILLLLLGAPVWIPVLLAVFAVILSVYVVIWSVIVSLWAALFAIAICAIASVFLCITEMKRGRLPQSAFYLGDGLILAGGSVLGFIAMKKLTVLTVRLSRAILLKIKSAFVRKGGSK